LDVEAFERLLGPCMELMKRNIDDYEDQLVKIFGSKANISDIRWTVSGRDTLPRCCTKGRDTFVQYIMYNVHKRELVPPTFESHPAYFEYRLEINCLVWLFILDVPIKIRRR